MNFSLQDAFEMQALIARYSYTFDSGDAEAWAETFTDEGVWEYIPHFPAQDKIYLRGRAELAAFCRTQISKLPPGSLCLHHQSGTLIDELSATAAASRTMVTITYQEKDAEPKVIMAGVYTDKWIKTGDGWRLQHRTLRA